MAEILLNTLNQTTVQLRRVTCHKCAAVYAIGEEFAARAQQNGRNWHCPYCDSSTVYSETDNEKLRKQLAEMQRLKEWHEARARDERDTRERVSRRLTAQRAATKRIKNRVAHGVCPCCTRSFENLRRHMDTKHPGYTAEKVAP